MQLTGRIAAVDGLKGIAILGVLFAHTVGRHMPHGWKSIDLWGYSVSPYTFLINAGFGVSIFFILSGFLLALPYARREKRMEGLRDAASFYKRRAARLLPMYFFTLFLILAISAPDPHPSGTLRHAFFFSTFTFPFTDWYTNMPPAMRPSYGPLWFVGTLFWLSVLFPILLQCIRRFGVERVLLSMLLFCLLLHMAASLLLPFAWSRLTFRLRTDEFVLGMSIAFLRANGSKPLKPWLQAGGGILLTALGLLLFDLSWMGRQMPFIAAGIAFLMIGIGLTLIIDVLLALPDKTQAMLFPAPLRLIGKMSYSLYLLHGTAIVALKPTLNMYRFIRYCALVFGLSWITHRYIENPERKA